VELSRGQNLALLAGIAVYIVLYVLRRWTRVLHERPR
jgi:hypothetical protein